MPFSSVRRELLPFTIQNPIGSNGHRPPGNAHVRLHQKGDDMQLACADVIPGLECPYVGVAESMSDLHAALVAHVNLAHAELSDGISEQGLEEYREEIDRRVLEMIASLN